MPAPKFSYSVSILITVSAEDIALLKRCAASHYDEKCRRSGAVGGFIHGWWNTLDDESERAEVYAEASELDTCLKILEIEFGSDLARRLCTSFNELQKETERVNAEE